MARTGRICLFDHSGAPLRIERAPLPDLAGGEALVRVTCCTLCGSDLHTFAGRRCGPTPLVLGHEIVGIVEALGPGDPTRDMAGHPIAPGDRIVWSVAADCGTCYFCTHGLPQKCESLLKYGHRRFDPANPFTGGLADYCHLARRTAIVKLPADLPDVVACLAGCTGATVVAALAASGGCTGETVLVQGLGMLGLPACARAGTDSGARRVIATDPDPCRRRLARTFGAMDAVPPGNALDEAIRAATEGRGVDLALEFSGSAEAVEAAFPLLRNGGRYVLVGSVSPTPPVAIDPEMIVRRMVTLRGVHNYAPCNLVTAVDFLNRRHREVPFRELVHGPFDLDSARQAFEHALAARSLRVAVCP